MKEQRPIDAINLLKQVEEFPQKTQGSVLLCHVTDAIKNAPTIPQPPYGDLVGRQKVLDMFKADAPGRPTLWTENNIHSNIKNAPAADVNLITERLKADNLKLRIALHQILTQHATVEQMETEARYAIGDWEPPTDI